MPLARKRSHISKSEIELPLADQTLNHIKTSIALTAVHIAHCSTQRFTVRIMAAMERILVRESKTGFVPFSILRTTAKATTVMVIAEDQANSSMRLRRSRIRPVSLLVLRRQAAIPTNIIAK